MSGADYVDPELRAGVRSARAKGIRCIKAVVKSKKKLDKEAKKVEGGGEAGKEHQAEHHDGAELCLSISVPMDPKEKNLEKEFVRCASSTLEEKRPCLLLFRTDGEENIEGCRWILLTWIPSACAEDDRARYMRSRGILSSLVTQPYFLQEVFAKGKKDLSWANISQYVVQNEAAKLAPPMELCSVNEHQPSGPLSLSQQVEPILQRFARRQDPCVRLQLLGAKAPIKWTGEPGKAVPTALVLDGKAHECKGAAYLAKSALPSNVCYFATMSNSILFFVSWCPDSGSKQKDSLRSLEEARCAVMRSVVLGYVLRAFSKTQQPSRVVQFSARDPTEIQDAIFKATEDTSSTPAQPADSKDAAAKSWPSVGGPADFPTDWPSSVVPTSMPSSLLLPERLVPPWRGGSKMHTIGASADSVGAQASISRSRRSVRPGYH